MGVEVLVVERERDAASSLVSRLRRLRIDAVVASSREEADASLVSGRPLRGFLVNPSLSARDDAGLDLLAAIATSPEHRFAPRAAVSRIASARLVTAAAEVGARYLCYPCNGNALRYFAFDVLAAPLEDSALRAYVNELGIAAGLSAGQLATLVAHVTGSHETVAARLEVSDSTVASLVAGVLARLRLFGANAHNMYSLEAWIRTRAPRRS